MQTPYKIVAWIISILIVLVVMAGLAFQYLFDPNDYKAQITKILKKYIKHRVQIHGNIKLSIFPWLGADIQKITLENPPEFHHHSFINIGDAKVKMKILPMIFGDFEIKKIVLDHVNIHLITLVNGNNNWHFGFKTNSTSQIVAKQTPSKAKQPVNTLGQINLDIKNIVIHNAQVHIINQQTHTEMEWSQINLKASNINRNNKVFPITFSGHFKLFHRSVELTLKALTHLAIHQNNFQLSDFKAFGVLSYLQSLIPHVLPYQLKIEQLSLNHQKLSIKGLCAKIAGVPVFSQIKSSGHGQISAKIQIPKINPKALIKSLSLKNLWSKLENPLLSASAKATINTHQVSFSDLDMHLGHSVIKAQGEYVKALKQFDFNVAIDQLNLNALPLASQAKKLGLAKQSRHLLRHQKNKPSSSIVLRKFLSSINWHGTVDIGTLMIKGLILHQVHLVTKNQADDMRIGPLHAHLYQGNLSGDIHLNIQSPMTHINSNISIEHASLAPIIHALFHRNFIDGKVNFKSNLYSSGNSQQALIHHLQGQGQIQVVDARLTGFNLDQLVMQAKHLLSNRSRTHVVIDKTNKNPFSRFSARYQITQGVLSNHDLLLITPHAKATGQGWVNFKDNRLHYQLKVREKTNNGEQSKWRLPIVVSGSLIKPRVSANMRAIFSDLLTHATDQLVSHENTTENSDKPQNALKRIKSLWHQWF